MIKFRVWDKTRNEYLSEEFVETFQFRLFNSVFYIFEQFTGLQDKNGVDIYLGDIVYYERDEENFEIGYDDTIGAISICNGDVCYTFDNLYGTELEVIGNINENKGVRKMSKAEKMFEALGYEQTKNSNDLIEYIDDSHGDGDYAYVRFNRMWKEYEVGFYDGYETKTNEPTRVPIKEHEAITQQMKELGWLE